MLVVKYWLISSCQHGVTASQRAFPFISCLSQTSWMIFITNNPVLCLADSGMTFKALGRAFIPDIAAAEKTVTQLKDSDLDTESTVL